MTLSVIYLEFKAHLTSMAATAFCRDTAILPRRRVMEVCIRSPGLHNHPTSYKIEMVWDESDCRVERMPRVCKAIIKAQGDNLKNLKYKIDFELFNTFLVTA